MIKYTNLYKYIIKMAPEVMMVHDNKYYFDLTTISIITDNLNKEHIKTN